MQDTVSDMSTLNIAASSMVPEVASNATANTLALDTAISSKKEQSDMQTAGAISSMDVGGGEGGGDGRVRHPVAALAVNHEQWQVGGGVVAAQVPEALEQGRGPEQAVGVELQGVLEQLGGGGALGRERPGGAPDLVGVEVVQGGPGGDGVVHGAAGTGLPGLPHGAHPARRHLRWHAVAIRSVWSICDRCVYRR